MKLGGEIKNIIFDLGGVLLNIDFSLAKNAFAQLGIPDFEKIYAHHAQNRLFDEFEKGKISPEKFRKELIKLFGKELTHSQIDAAWNALLLDFPYERMELLKKLKTKYRLFLLSNTNAIHIQEVSNILHRTFGYRDMQHVFEKEYYSYNMGMRKPDPEIFEFVISENKLNPEETVFIDDSSPNIEGAAKTGIKVLHLQSPQTILDINF